MPSPGFSRAGGTRQRLGPGAILFAEWQIQRRGVVDRTLVPSTLIHPREDRRQIKQDIGVWGLERDRDLGQWVADRPDVSVGIKSPLGAGNERVIVTLGPLVLHRQPRPADQEIELHEMDLLMEQF